MHRLRPTGKERDEILREFFPPERTEPSYDFGIVLIASWPGDDNKRDVKVLLQVDELPEPPKIELIDTLVIECERLVPDGAVIVSSNAEVVKNLTDDEREEF